jgi:O-acetyl-ADP-ribose deacetylase (regulator of RNase III)
LIGKIAPGQAVVTAAFDLPAKYVIHAVAPRYLDGTRNEAETLRQAYASICRVISENLITQVSLPSLGTGIYRFPLSLAANIAYKTLHEQLPTNCAATFVCFDQETLAAYEQAIFR